MKFLLSACSLGLLLLGTAQAKIEYVLQITVDGLRGDALEADMIARPSLYPGFTKLKNEGSSTFKARCDYDYSETIPNHSGIVTGRPVLEPTGVPTISFTAATDDTCTAVGHGLKNGEAFQVSGTLPGGLTASTNYYAVAITTDSFKVSSTLGGSPIDLTTTGSGTLTRKVSHGFTANSPAPGDTIHKAAGAAASSYLYKSSTFDMAHDRGFSTAIIGGKTRLNLIQDSYNATNGALDQSLTPTNNGKAKIDFISIADLTSAASLVNIKNTLVGQIGIGGTTTLRQYSLVHFTDTDTGTAGGGHQVGWNSASWLTNGAQVVDSYLVAILNAIAANTATNGKVAIVLTADHGGGGLGTGGSLTSHTASALVENHTIPMFIWGPGIPAGDAYALFRNRLNPGTSRPNTSPVTTQPLRNLDTANIAMTLLGAPLITGSYFQPEMKDTPTISKSGGQVTVSWPLFLTGYTLESSGDLTGPWVSETPSIVETSTQFQTTMPVTETKKFWRMRRPQ